MFPATTMKAGGKKQALSEKGCTECLNSNCLIKKNLHAGPVEDFTAGRKLIHCRKGQQFIMEGAPVNGLFFLLQGKVKVYRTGIHGREQIVRFAHEGEIIGHRGFGTGEYYPICALALEDSMLCYFSKEQLQHILRHNNGLTYDLMLFYANELNRSEAKVKSISQMSVRERVIDTLLYIYRKFGQHNGYLSMQLSRKEYADYAGTTEEQVIRTFSALKREKLLKAQGRKIGLPDVSLLRKELSDHHYFLDS